MSERHRIDNWLKLVCLYKHRADATEACKGGLVKINGNRVKPAAVVREGDTVEITGERLRKFVVLAIPAQNVSKEVARTMYRDESPAPPPVEPRIAERERGAGRPTKKDRRELERVKRS